MKKLKLWGPLRSGTNYLGRVMELNFKEIEVVHNQGGWKHGPPQATFPHGFHGHLLIIKNPFAWIASMQRYNMMPTMPLGWYCEKWNTHARELFSFSWHDHACLIRYERLIKFFQIQMEEVQSQFRLERMHGVYVDEQRKMLRGGDDMKGENAVSGQKRDLSYYKTRKYMQKFSAQEKATVRRHIDPYLILQLNYKDEFDELTF